jgi:hypothetical protein
MEIRSLALRVATTLLIAFFVLANIFWSFRMQSPSSLKNEAWRPPNEVVVVSPPQLLHNKSRRRIFLIHVGKTGGETVRHTLKVTCRMRKNEVHQKACWDSFANTNNTTAETALSKHTIGTMHCNVILPKRGMERATTLLWTLRNPVTRVISWFSYLNPANCRPLDDYYSTACNTNRSIINSRTANRKGSQWTTKFFTCFPTVNQFANALIIIGKPSPSLSSGNESLVNSSNCSELAWRTVRGEASPSSSHIYFNHKYYWQETMAKYPRVEIWVARTEYLWDDLDGIEQRLLKKNTSETTTTTTSNHHPHWKRNVTHGSESHVQKEDLSPLGQKNLCCALLDEIAIYGNLLRQSTNLEPFARDESLWQVARQCGADSWEGLLNASVCLNHLQQEIL